MPYQLIFSELTQGVQRDVGENVFLENLPAEYKVYLFYYPGAMGNEELESQLRKLGEMTGKNLFVNIGSLNDPNYNKIAGNFQIKKLPAVVMTATADLASPPSDYLSSYVRIDNPKLLNEPDKIRDLLQKLFNLFISGNIADALKEAKKDDRKALLARIGKIIADALKVVGKFIDERDFNISFLEGKLEITRH
jgi:hypothetical protein